MTTTETNHMSEDAARQSESVTADRCKHEELCFHSGGHYVYCPACRGWWVARKNAHTSDEDIDYDRSAKSDVIGGEVRVRRTPSQPAASGGVADALSDMIDVYNSIALTLADSGAGWNSFSGRQIDAMFIKVAEARTLLASIRGAGE